MTNEQTLEYLRIMAILNGNETPLEGIEQIKKDLKVLEILKKNLKYDIDGNIVLKMGYKNKNYKTVKEWLENE